MRGPIYGIYEAFLFLSIIRGQNVGGTLPRLHLGDYRVIGRHTITPSPHLRPSRFVESLHTRLKGLTGNPGTQEHTNLGAFSHDCPNKREI